MVDRVAAASVSLQATPTEHIGVEYQLAVTVHAVRSSAGAETIFASSTYIRLRVGAGEWLRTRTVPDTSLPIGQSFLFNLHSVNVSSSLQICVMGERYFDRDDFICEASVPIATALPGGPWWCALVKAGEKQGAVQLSFAWTPSCPAVILSAIEAARKIKEQQAKPSVPQAIETPKASYSEKFSSLSSALSSHQKSTSSWAEYVLRMDDLQKKSGWNSGQSPPFHPLGISPYHPCCPPLVPSFSYSPHTYGYPPHAAPFAYPQNVPHGQQLAAARHSESVAKSDAAPATATVKAAQPSKQTSRCKPALWVAPEPQKPASARGAVLLVDAQAKPETPEHLPAARQPVNVQVVSPGLPSAGRRSRSASVTASPAITSQAPPHTQLSLEASLASQLPASSWDRLGPAQPGQKSAVSLPQSSSLQKQPPLGAFDRAQLMSEALHKFVVHDFDHSNTLSEQEFAVLIRSSAKHEHVTDRDVAEMFEQLDVDRNGRIDVGEYLQHDSIFKRPLIDASRTAKQGSSAYMYGV